MFSVAARSTFFLGGIMESFYGLSLRMVRDWAVDNMLG